MEQFELLEVRIGKEVLYARPIAWSNVDNPAEEGTKAIEYETACPNCSQMMHFKTEDIEKINDENYVTCTMCGKAPDNDGDDKKEGTSINYDTPDISTKDIKKQRPQRTEPSISPSSKDDDCPFQDPVEAGELKLSS